MKTVMSGVLSVVVSLVVGLFVLGPLYAILRGVEVPGPWAVAHSGILFARPIVAILCFPVVAGIGQLLRRWARKS